MSHATTVRIVAQLDLTCRDMFNSVTDHLLQTSCKPNEKITFDSALVVECSRLYLPTVVTSGNLIFVNNELNLGLIIN
jgi:hypothetical protein